MIFTTEHTEVTETGNVLSLNDLSGKVIGAAMEMHRHLGPGLLKSTYEACLAYELLQAGLKVERQKVIAGKI